MMRLPSHGIRLGSPPKLHGQATTQLQLSAPVADSCHDGDCARDGTVRTTSKSAATGASVRIYICPSIHACRVSIRSDSRSFAPVLADQRAGEVPTQMSCGVGASSTTLRGWPIGI